LLVNANLVLVNANLVVVNANLVVVNVNLVVVNANLFVVNANFFVVNANLIVVNANQNVQLIKQVCKKATCKRTLVNLFPKHGSKAATLLMHFSPIVEIADLQTV
jgi:hypothetical protein